jgi:hypothetical protein
VVEAQEGRRGARRIGVRGLTGPQSRDGGCGGGEEDPGSAHDLR